MPPPTDKQGVMRLLGMVNFVQRFAPLLSEVTAPIRNLLKKENDFEWSANHQAVFTKIKELFTSTPVLKYFDEKMDIVLQCDSSESGLGACIMQDGHPVGFY